MSSIIEGYTYDIFISYRQKDNKHDGWVTKFVENLKGELEATFKEDVSVYFDENPHDRLQETHNVGKSLEGKLKCLIFIPILSQTYCDPDSYAWQYEFLAFLRMAETDHFGKDIKLRSGNVASRILPIRIHDLEQEDIKLFEKETGSVLRAMDFVFKTVSGVSRPLIFNEDHPNDNLNKTFYRDQMNKVTHAIKEIIIGMKAEPVQVHKEKPQREEPWEEVKKEEKKVMQEKPDNLHKRKLLSGVIVIAVLLVIAAIIAYPKIFKRNTLDKLKSSEERISIAVMPFQNMTNDTTWNVWQDGIQGILTTFLSNSGELRVRQTESINNLIQSKVQTNYASITPSVARAISQKLDANIFIFGSINQSGTTIRINAQLIDSNSDEVFKSFQIDGIADKILPILDSLAFQVNNFLIISNLKKGISPDDYQLIATTNSPEAYSLFLLGNKAFRNADFFSSYKLYLQALAIDSNFIEAALKLSIAYYDEYFYDEAKRWCLMGYKKRDQMPLQLKIITNRVHAILFETQFEEIKYLRQLQELDDLVPSYYYSSGYAYSQLLQFEKAIPEYEKALEIYNKSGIKPAWVFNYTQLGEAYNKTGQYKKERKLYKKAEKDFPDNLVLNYQKCLLATVEGDTVNAKKYLEKGIRIAKENSWTEANIAAQIAFGFSDVGKKDKAEEYYRKALTLEPGKPDRMNDLAFLLIDSDRNLPEGMKLIDKALELSPDNYKYLYCKGWGLFRQRKYEEALEMLQKSWDLRREKAVYDHGAFLHLEAAKKAVASQKNN